MTSMGNGQNGTGHNGHHANGNGSGRHANGNGKGHHDAGSNGHRDLLLGPWSDEPAKRIGFVFGTRPEAIKLAPVIAACRETPGLQPVVCVTAQHRDLLDQVLSFFGIVPDEDLDLMRDGQSVSGFAARSLTAVGEWLDRQRLDAVLIQGDTTSAFMGALAAFYRKIPIGHVEAGLRTHQKYEPFPEEANRRLTTQLADLHFAPTEAAAANLLGEGIEPSSVHVTGNTVVDAVLHVRDMVGRDGLVPPVPVAAERSLITATIHRRENFGQPLRRICGAIGELVDRNESLEVVIPVHPNPQVRPVIWEELGGRDRVRLIEPPNYLQFIALLMASDVVLTDSGGVQEEAPVLGKPTLVLRRVTERPEGVEAGAARVVGDVPETIVSEIERLLEDDEYYRGFATPRLPYGDGQASRRIAGILRDHL
jgi:UDP-N-acetylglucosamine 2-epimerase (non-hydrolysing)